MDGKHHDNPQNAHQIRQSVFDAIIKGCKCDTGEDVETVGLRSDLFGYSISFYAEQKDNYELIVEEFGQNQKGKWIDCEPTEEQLSKMRSMLKKEVERIQTLIDEEELEEAYAMQQQADEMKYGRPDTLYNSCY